MRPDYDYLILGQGLAGSLLAWQLMQQGCRVCVIDDAVDNSSSRVAAGLINPVIGQRLVLHAEVPMALSAAHSLYQQLGEYFSQAYYHPRTMYRVLKDSAEQRLWQKRIQQLDYIPYLSAQPCNLKDVGLAEHTAIEQFYCGYLDSGELLKDLRQYLQSQESYFQQTVHLESLEINPQGIRLGAHQADALILCDGFHAIDNPWFANLPWQLSQGEILTLEINGLSLDAIINGRYWLLPLSDGRFRIGASYSQTLDLLPKQANRTAMLSELKRLLDQEYDIQVIAHQVGIRPNTLDKQPFIGQHPQQKNMFMFNGFGSRGSLLIPYYAELMAAHLLHDTALPDVVNIQRIY